MDVPIQRTHGKVVLSSDYVPVYESENTLIHRGGELIESMLIDHDISMNRMDEAIVVGNQKEGKCTQCTIRNSFDSALSEMSVIRRPDNVDEKEEWKEQSWKCRVCSFFNAHFGGYCTSCLNFRGVGIGEIILNPRIAPYLKQNDGFLKNSFLVASIGNSFQLSLRTYPCDPLQIRVVSGVEYLAIPHIRMFGGNYNPFPCRMLLELNDTPFSGPVEIAHAIAGKGEIEFYFVVHENLLVDESRCRINAMMHMWAFSHVYFDDTLIVSDNVEIGLFCPSNGVVECSDAMYDSLTGPIPFHRLSKRVLISHHGACLPNNADFEVDSRPYFLTFYLVCAYNNRCVVSYHVIPNKRVQGALFHAMEESASLSELIDDVEEDDRIFEFGLILMQFLNAKYSVR